MADSPIMRPPRNPSFSQEVVGPGNRPEVFPDPFRQDDADVAPVPRVTGRRPEKEDPSWSGPKPFTAS